MTLDVDAADTGAGAGASKGKGKKGSAKGKGKGKKGKPRASSAESMPFAETGIAKGKGKGKKGKPGSRKGSVTSTYSYGSDWYDPPARGNGEKGKGKKGKGEKGKKGDDEHGKGKGKGKKGKGKGKKGKKGEGKKGTWEKQASSPGGQSTASKETQKMPWPPEDMEDIFLVSNEEIPIKKLLCKEAFENLTMTEKRYAHFMSRASWQGSLICLSQASKESPQIFEMLHLAFSKRTCDKVRVSNSGRKAGTTTTYPPKGSDMWHFYQYCAQFYGNMGNYTSFGDKKFLPRIGKTAFRDCLYEHASYLPSYEKSRVYTLWSKTKAKIYSLEDDEKQLNKDNTYYLGDIHKITDEDLEVVRAFMSERGYEAWNSRLRKSAGLKDSSDETKVIAEDVLEIIFASYYRRKHIEVVPGYKGKTIKISYGDYGGILFDVAWNLRQAQRHCANDTQAKMLECYCDHFELGEFQKHVKSQELWVQDKGPAVETNIGFIENYRDPYGERAEFEGLVAMVNRPQSVKFSNLVAAAEKLIPALPWPKDFEQEVFKKPDFTALDVLTFASSGIPIGINIPNYYQVKEQFGFKNVHLHNVLSSRWASGENEQAERADPITFIREQDQALFQKLRLPAFELQVGLHELLGHGSGKQLSTKDIREKYITNPITGQIVTSAYEEGQNYSGVFGPMSSSWEECRAESVALYLGLEPLAMEIFSFKSDEEQGEVTKIGWLSMAHAGLVGTEFYNPDTKKWGQAHSQARFAILQVLLKSGVVKLEGKGTDDLTLSLVGADGAASLNVIRKAGKAAIGDLLIKLNCYKAMADVKSATSLWAELTTLDAEWVAMRETVLKKKKPRPVFVQPQTKIRSFNAYMEHLHKPSTTEEPERPQDDAELSPSKQGEAGDISLVEYPPTFAGLFASFQEHIWMPSSTTKIPADFKKKKRLVGDLDPDCQSADMELFVVKGNEHMFGADGKLLPQFADQTAYGATLASKRVEGAPGKDATTILSEQAKHAMVVGDQTGVIKLVETKARVKTGDTVLLRRACVQMVAGFMHLTCRDRPVTLLERKIKANTNNDVSAIEYQLVTTDESDS
ncbi:unnamed protein product [Amoebophrya sp. A25]|nr:unnamed protein product [Amoebophrya sp. A25]|eukprot:GSA25T00018646001.1